MKSKEFDDICKEKGIKIQFTIAESVGIMFMVWLYVTDVVLDGNTHGMALNMMRIKKYAGEQFRRCVPAGMPCRDRGQTRRSTVQEVRTPVHSFQGREKHTWGFLCLIFGI